MNLFKCAHCKKVLTINHENKLLKWECWEIIHQFSAHYTSFSALYLKHCFIESFILTIKEQREWNLKKVFIFESDDLFHDSWIRNQSEEVLHKGKVIKLITNLISIRVRLLRLNTFWWIVIFAGRHVVKVQGSATLSWLDTLYFVALR